VYVAEQPIITITIGAEWVGCQSDSTALLLNDTFGEITGGLTKTLHWLAGMVRLGCIDANHADPFQSAIHVYTDRISVIKLTHPVFPRLQIEKLLLGYRSYPAQQQSDGDPYKTNYEPFNLAIGEDFQSFDTCTLPRI
jgi:hypothetical protein